MFTPSTKVTAEGFIPFVVQGETFQTWHKVFGDISDRTHPPLVVAHGGPGLSHDYLLPMSDLATDRAVIFYDQIGNSRSTHLPEKPTEFWNVNLFLDELENLLAHFGIQDNFDLFGHSWGSVLGMEFVVRRHPAGLKHFVIANSLGSVTLWDQSLAGLISAFPKDVQEGYELRWSDPVKYRPAVETFFASHVCRAKPSPPEVTYSHDQHFGNPTVPKAMFEGELREWSIVDRVSAIRVPALIINGKYDVSNDSVVKPLVDGIPNAKWVRLEESSHIPVWEEREKHMEIVREFLST